MIDTVLFDMGGTLEDIYVDDASKEASAREVLRILKEKGFSVSMDVPEAMQELAEGWDRYAAYRGPTNRELKPEEIWGNYVLNGRFGLDFETVKPFAEELAHMWEVTYYHRSLRPGVKELLEGLKGLGMKLGVVCELLLENPGEKHAVLLEGSLRGSHVSLEIFLLPD